MNIDLPSLDDQRKFIFEEATKESIALLQSNLEAVRYPSQRYVDEITFPSTHLLREDQGWVAPDPELVKAYFFHFQDYFSQYSTDAKLACLLGIKGSGNDRRIRAFKDGSKKVPYGIWRRFLIITGRVPQDVVKVLAYMG